MKEEKKYSYEANERYERMINRIINSMTPEERVFIVNRDARCSALCKDFKEAQKNHKHLTMTIIHKQIKARHDEVLCDHVQRRLKDMVENGDIGVYIDEDQHKKFNSMRGSLYLCMDALDSILNDIQGLLDANGIPGDVKMMREIKNAREAIDKWSKEKLFITYSEAQDLACEECDKIYEHIKERTEVLGRKAQRLLDKLEKMKQS